MSAPGFMVWSPEGQLPTYVHPTFKSALAEAERLKRQCRHRRFYVMSPVDGLAGAQSSSAFDQGRAEGLAQAHREIMDAEAAHDRLADANQELKRHLKSAEGLIKHARDFQATVADCLLWFDGFTAAYAQRETYEQPRVPAREKIQALNLAFQVAMHATDSQSLSDDEIPF